jgi:hypothetical protein
MKFSEVKIPSEKIKLLLGLIKKAVRGTKDFIFVCITPKGLHAVVNDIHFVVPVLLPLEIDGIKIRYTDIEVLLKSQGDVIFSSCDSDNFVTITYTVYDVVKKIEVHYKSDVVLDFEYYKTPENVIESSKFLSAITMCSPCRDKDKYNPKYILHRFCIEGNEMITTNGRCLIVAHDLDINSLVFELTVSKEKPNGYFLLDDGILPLLPKSGTCRLAALTEKVIKPDGSTHDVAVLRIGFSDYFIFTTSSDSRFPRWKSILPVEEKKAHKLHIDPRDAQVCLRQLKTLPKSSQSKYEKENYVYVHIEEGRLCIDSCSSEIGNIRLCCSEFTTGSIADNVYLDVHYLSTALEVASEMSQNPIRISKINEAHIEIQPLHFESDIATFVVMPAKDPASKQEMKEITFVIDVKKYWEQPKKQVVQKSRCSTLFFNAEQELVTQLKLENEQLKKENEQLRNAVSMKG